jgi:hypothetical protein
MKTKLTHKQWRFVLEYLKSGNATSAAISAGYARKAAYATAYENLKKPQIKAAIREVNQMVESADIMAIAERKKRLSQIARASVCDFIKIAPSGETIYTYGPNSNYIGAVREIITGQSSSEGGGDGARDLLIKGIRLHCPLKAIDLLNKMDGLYEEQARPTSNTTVVFNVKDSNGKPVNLCDPQAIRSL